MAAKRHHKTPSARTRALQQAVQEMHHARHGSAPSMPADGKVRGGRTNPAPAPRRYESVRRG